MVMTQDKYLPQMNLEQVEKIMKRVRVSDSCWEWLGRIDRKGYARSPFSVNGKAINPLVHRVIFYIYHGGIDSNLVIDHLCRNRSCLNPAHMEQVTNLVNVQRGDKNKTHCVNGHEFSKENTRYRNRLMTYGVQTERICVACKRARARKAKV